MSTILINNREFDTYIEYPEIEKAIDKVAARINSDFRGCSDIPIVLCVLNGALMFTGELMKRLDFNCVLDTVRISSYEGTRSTGTTSTVLGMKSDIRGRRVIVVEDIVDTGRTIEDLSDMLRNKGAAEVRICTMLLKPDIYKGKARPDYVAMEIEPKFIAGFGLDYDELGRNTKDIYAIREK